VGTSSFGTTLNRLSRSMHNLAYLLIVFLGIPPSSKIEHFETCSVTAQGSTPTRFVYSFIFVHNHASCITHVLLNRIIL
jgi:hypothetical protein